MYIEGRRENKRKIEEEEESGCHLSTQQEKHREYPEMVSVNILIWASQVALNFPGGSDGKVSAYNVGDPGSIPGLGSPGEGNGTPLQYSCLENPMDGGAW